MAASMESMLKSLRLEGNLLKYTNVVRGFQIRYFIVNTDTAKLDYYMSEDAKSQRPRGYIELKNAVISPSEEDSITFTINSPENEIFKLRAQDAKERQHWVNILRLVSQSFATETNINTNVNHTMQNNASSSHIIASNGENSHSSSSLSIVIPSSNESFDFKNSDYKISNFELVKEIFYHVKLGNQKLESLIAELPRRSSNLSKYDKDILILKATARSCVNYITECCHILKYSQKKKSVNYEGEICEKLSALRSDANGFRKDTNSSFKSKIDMTLNNIIPLSPSITYNGAKSSVDSYNVAILNSSKLNHQHSTRIKSFNHDDDHNDEDENDDAGEITDADEPISPSTTADGQRLFEENKNILLSTISNLKSGMDLTKVSVPMILLDRRSLLEMFADCFSHINLFIRIVEEKSAEERMVAILQWYLSLFHFIQRETIAKKPFNPILGEVFRCSWKLNESNESYVVNFVAEQVSHHPAITAFYLECKEKKIKLNANVHTKSKYSGTSISVKLMGELTLKLEAHNEEYKFTLPNCYARSITSKPWMELGDSCVITCLATGYRWLITFKVRPFLGTSSTSSMGNSAVQATANDSSSSYQVFAELRAKNNDLIGRATGNWNGRLDFESFVNQKWTPRLSLDVNSLKVYRKRVRAIELQELNESRRVWASVSDSLKKHDLNAANNHKCSIEKQQRTLEKQRKDQNVQLVSRFFHKVRTSSTTESSLKLIDRPSQSSSDEDDLIAIYKWTFKNF